MFLGIGASLITPAISDRISHNAAFSVLDWLPGLVIAPWRKQIDVFLSFSDRIDAIVDDDSMETTQKIQHLEHMRAAFLGKDNPLYPEAVACRQMMMAHHIGLFCGLERFKAAFIMVHQRNCPDWSALVTHAHHQGAPLARLILGLTGEDRALGPLADQLAAAVTILNQMARIHVDFAAGQRIFLPDDWLMKAAVTERMMRAPCLSDPVRQVLDQVLSGVDGMLLLAAPLKDRIRNHQMAAGIYVIETLALEMAYRLRHDDPFMRDLSLGRWSFFRALVKGGQYYVARILR